MNTPTLVPRVAVLGLVLLGAVTAVGCSQRGSSPLAPSRAAAPAGADLRIGAEQNAPPATVAMSSQTVSSMVSGYSCPTVRFYIGSYLLKTSTSTTYSGGSCANIKAGSLISFTGTKSDNVIFLSTVTFGGSASTPAPEPPAGKQPEPAPPNNTITVTISTIVSGTSCPDLQFEAAPSASSAKTSGSSSGAYLFKTSAATTYDGGGCGAVKAGLTVVVTAEKTSSGRTSGGTSGLPLVFVSKISFTTPVEATFPFEADVTVDALADGSSCPYLVFKSDGRKFAAAKGTRYDGGHCEKVRAGSQLRVTGERREKDDLMMVASVLFLKAADDGEGDGAPGDDDAGGEPKYPASAVPVTGEAFVGEHLADTKCPTLSFKLGSTPAKVTAATVFLTGDCDSIKSGSKVAYSGQKLAEGLIIVTHAAVTPPPAPVAPEPAPAPPRRKFADSDENAPKP